MKIRQLTITTIVLLASSLTVAGCGDPKLDCPGVTACKASAEAIAKEMRMTDAETEKFKKNLEAFPAVTLLNEFKAAKTREAFDAFYNFNSRKMPRDQMEKFAMNLLNGKTAKEVNDFIDANKGAKEEIRKIEELFWNAASVKQQVELCYFDTESLNDCNSGSKADPSKGQRGWSFEYCRDYTVQKGVITGEYKGEGYTVKVKFTPEVKKPNVNWTGEYGL